MPLAERSDAFSRVRMFTTEGPTWSTRSVKSGRPRTTADCAIATPWGSTATLATAATMPDMARARNILPSNLDIIDLS
ncbi:hypothetical protein D3C86_2056900 [compost metagenome]